MKPFSLLVKPASADCNLRCAYCFYLDRCELYPGTPQHRMDDAVLETLVRGYMATSQPQYVFGWQGGEPTLMGLPFFERVVALQQQYGRSGCAVANGLQTNGTSLTEALAGHLARYQFLTGVSVDGPAALHDRFRRSADGHATHAQVLKGIACLRQNRAEFNVLTLVSQANVAHPETVYTYLRDELGVNYHQYIECVEFDAEGRLRPFAVSAQEWGGFLCRLFDCWYAHDTHRVSVRLFDTVLAKLVDGVDTTCASGRSCSDYFVVEYNGDVYPCDFHVRPDLRLGNVRHDSWESLQATPAYVAFAARKCCWNAACAACPYLRLCNGDCPKNRGGPEIGDPRRLSHLCAGWRQFYAHALPRLELLARDVRCERASRLATPAARGAAPAGAPTPGRNASCPCGSGRKFKRCCGAAG